jgi:hypothetical protein
MVCDDEPTLQHQVPFDDFGSRILYAQSFSAEDEQLNLHDAIL